MGVSLGIDMSRLDVCFGGFTPTVMGDMTATWDVAVEAEQRLAARKDAAIRAEENKLDAQKEALRPWTDLDLPLETGSTGQVTIQLGTLPAALPIGQADG